MARFPVEVVTGVSIGFLIGIVYATVVCVASFARRHFDGPRLGAIAVVVGAPIVTLGGGLLIEMLRLAPAQIPRFLIASFVVAVLAVGAGSVVDRVIAQVPPRGEQSVRRSQPLSTDAFEWVDEGIVIVRLTGDIEELEGYPPFGSGHEKPSETQWEFPADLPLSELETRLEDRLMTNYELAACEVSIDDQGRATIAAAPSSQSAQAAVPDGYRSISISATVPSDLTAGDIVTIDTALESVTGTVLGNNNTGDDLETDDEVTVAVPTSDAGTLLESDHDRILVEPRRQNATAEAVSLLEWGSRLIRKVQLDSAVRRDLENDESVITVIAAGSSNATTGGSTWQLLPEPSALSDNSTAFVIGERSSISMLDTGSLPSGSKEGDR